MMWPPLRCSECSDDMFYDKYIDADDGRGERPICVDYSQYVEVKGLSSNERYDETNYYDTMGTDFSITYSRSAMDLYRHYLSDELTRRHIAGTLELADRLKRSQEDRNRDRLASSDPEG